jgi:hypothetical protein
MQIRSILSIDFDKFLSQDLDAEARLFDGKVAEAPAWQDRVQWLRRYYHSPELLDVFINDEDLVQCLDFLFKCLQDIPVYIADSHRYLVRFLIEVIEHLHSPSVVYDIYNIDNHHDIYYGEIPDLRAPPKANNWLYYTLLSNKLHRYVWIRNKNPMPFSGESEFDFTETESYDVLKEVKFDGIFVCKSSSWIPPHLHGRFDTFVNAMRCHFNKFIYSDEPEVLSRELSAEGIREAISLVNRAKWKS